MQKYEVLSEPFDKFSVCNEGFLIDLDTETTVPVQFDDKNGRQYVRLVVKNELGNTITRVAYVHKLVADMFVPNHHGDAYVAFIDGNELNCHADNLQWVATAFEAQEPQVRPLRRIVEPERHRLMCEIGEAIINDDWDTAQRLGDRVWNLEGDNSDIQTEYDWS